MRVGTQRIRQSESQHIDHGLIPAQLEFYKISYLLAGVGWELRKG
jgi:hypothetical protein